MIKNITVVLFALLVFSSAGAQEINFVMQNGVANKKYEFTIYNGLTVDTVASGVVSVMGAGKILIPEKYKGVKALGGLSFEGENPIFLILDGNDFSFNQKEGGGLHFVGSFENDLLYNKPDELRNPENIETYASFHANTLNTLRLLSKAQQQGASLFDRGSAKIAALQLDVDKLYYSRFWFFVIDGMLRLSTSNDDFSKDMITLLEKTKTDEVFVALVSDLIMITGQYGMDDAFDTIVSYVEETNRIKYPQGAIYDAFAMVKVKKGTVAPLLDGLDKSVASLGSQYTLLMFYHPDCENCHEQLATITKDYDFYKNKNVRIVTISADMDQQSFAKDVEIFPWKDQLCDYKGYAGINFQRFGILATPTLYLLDEKGVVLGRYALISDVKLRL